MSSERRGRDAWICIYPAYLNAKKTREEGRRTPLDKAIENPTIQEIVEALKFLKLEHVVEEDKMYPRDIQKGRIRVSLKDAVGKPLNPELPSRNLLFLQLGALLVRYRQNVQSTQASSSSASSSAAGKKKKGKR
eukprot:TRINITY_DN11222_c0_g1::TRINITY_DN11222_c0_g1_i1::g.744::m.744 TRINITY_DN11222_c0_g1::TRINITY_DN11222_c0_g1_i1::g.744  ORF type:complete len:134 (+),score=14.77,sp/P49964/SRP19_ORYSJ/43.48/2e-24,SRP19/PF01922.12/1.4e-26 TRINITY_DN11222_c0_g1_i1:103-504(+)